MITKVAWSYSTTLPESATIDLSINWRMRHDLNMIMGHVPQMPLPLGSAPDGIVRGALNNFHIIDCYMKI